MFVCTGNICRSPMAELVMKQLVRKEGLDWVILSAANTGDEVGNPVYPPVRALLEARGISCKGKYSVQLRREDYPNYDYFIGMDARNRRDMLRIFGGPCGCAAGQSPRGGARGTRTRVRRCRTGCRQKA